jgi:hypothetical protein
MSKRGGTAPRPEKAENIFTQSRVPTSSSKYAMSQIPTSGISVKGAGFSSHNPRQPVKTSGHNERVDHRVNRPAESPIPEDFEHVWEEGTKRPKTQNIKCRRTSTGKEASSEIHEIFPSRGPPTAGKLYEVPIIVVSHDKSRRIASAHKTSKYAARPATNKPAGPLLSSLDQEFLDMFQV